MPETIPHVYSRYGLRVLWAFGIGKILRKSILISVLPPGLRHREYLRTQTTDIDAYEYVILEHSYDCELPRPPSVIVDAGANIGLTAVYFANRHPSARVIAIEPEMDNFRLLAKNTAPYKNVMAIPVALWSENALLALNPSGEGEWGFRAKASN